MEAHDTPNTTAERLTAAVPHRTRMLTNAVTLSLVALLLIALISLGALLTLRGHGGKTTLPPVGSPAAVSESQLESLASQSSQPIYWAGPKHAPMS